MTRPRFHPLFSEPDGLEGREEDRALHLCRGCCPGGGKAGSQGAEAHSLPPAPLPSTGDATGRPTPPLPGQGIPEARAEEQVTAPTDVLVTPAPSGTCNSPMRCGWPEPTPGLSHRMHSVQ